MNNGVMQRDSVDKIGSHIVITLSSNDTNTKMFCMLKI